MDEHELLIRRATFGKQVEQFLSSDIGKYLMSRSEDDVVSAFNELKKCDPRDGKVVEKWQNQIYRAESFAEWCTDAIQDGLNAIQILEEPY